MFESSSRQAKSEPKRIDPALGQRQAPKAARRDRGPERPFQPLAAWLGGIKCKASCPLDPQAGDACQHEFLKTGLPRTANPEKACVSRSCLETLFSQSSLHPPCGPSTYEQSMTTRINRLNPSPVAPFCPPGPGYRSITPDDRPRPGANKRWDAPAPATPDVCQLRGAKVCRPVRLAVRWFLFGRSPSRWNLVYAA